LQFERQCGFLSYLENDVKPHLRNDYNSNKIFNLNFKEMKMNEIYEAPKCESYELNLEELVCISGGTTGNGFLDEGEEW